MLPLVIQIERTEEHVADTCAFARSPVRIGRNPLSDLQLEESFVSQWHAVICFDEESTSYVDLGSTNPTLVDGQPIERNVEIMISDATDIRIGSLRLHMLRVAAPPELFGARRKTSFARTGSALPGDSSEATLFLGRVAAPSPLPFAPTAIQAPPAAGSGRHSRPASARTPTELTRLHDDYQASRERFLAEARRQLERESGPAREAAFERLIDAFPELGHEPGFRRLIKALGISAWRSGVPDIGDWLSRLTDGMYPPPGQLGATNSALAMERIGEMLEVFSSAFIELRVAREQFRAEMSLPAPPPESLLDTSRNPRALLAFLLNPAADGGSRIGELARAMADLALHQVALVSAALEGARDVLQELSPDTLTGRDRPGASFFAKLLGNDQRDLWSRYVRTFDEMLDSARFARALFGSSFARKYNAITGGGRALPVPPRADSDR